MSLEFLQFRMPCETCIVQSMCKDKRHTSDIKLNKSIPYCLALPDWDLDKKIHLKGLFECWINLGEKIGQELSRTKLDNIRIRDKKSLSIPNQYINMLIDITASLQWIVNSASWHEGELYNFDSFEVKEKLKNITNWLENGK